MANSKPQILATESKERGELGGESAGGAGGMGGVSVGATLSGAFWGAKAKAAREPRERRRLNSRNSSPSQLA